VGFKRANFGFGSFPFSGRAESLETRNSSSLSPTELSSRSMASDLFSGIRVGIALATPVLGSMVKVSEVRVPGGRVVD
jgi:hypothetical protein